MIPTISVVNEVQPTYNWGWAHFRSGICPLLVDNSNFYWEAKHENMWILVNITDRWWLVDDVFGFSLSNREIPQNQPVFHGIILMALLLSWPCSPAATLWQESACHLTLWCRWYRWYRWPLFWSAVFCFFVKVTFPVCTLIVYQRFSVIYVVVHRF